MPYQVVVISDPNDPHVKGKVYQVEIVGGGSQVMRMPEPTEATKGQILHYKGVTTDDYTHGYFYECIKTVTRTSSVTFDDETVTCTGANFAAFLDDIMQDIDRVASGDMKFAADASLWYFTGRDSAGNVVVSYNLYQEDLENYGFVFSGTYEDNDVVNFTCSIEESSATYAWEQLNVQPTSES